MGMTTIIERFKASARMLSNVRALTLSAMLIALNLALSSVRIYITPELRLGLGFLTQGIAGMLMGPVVAMLTGAAGDILSLVCFPSGAYFPGYTLTAVLGGAINGLMLFQRRELRYTRALVTRALINTLCNIGLNTLWLYMTTGQAIIALLPTRAIKNIALMPIEALLLYLVAKAVDAARRRTRIL